MGHHINSKGQFQSDKNPDLPPDKITLSFKDHKARASLIAYAARCRNSDKELSEDIFTRLKTIEEEASD